MRVNVVFFCHVNAAALDRSRSIVLYRERFLGRRLAVVALRPNWSNLYSGTGMNSSNFSRAERVLETGLNLIEVDLNKLSHHLMNCEPLLFVVDHWSVNCSGLDRSVLRAPSSGQT